MKKLWNDKEYPIYNLSILTEEVLEKYINLFWKDVISKISTDQHILLLLKVKFTDNQYKSLNDLQKINIKSKEGLLVYFKDKLQLFNETYKVIPISSLIFSYGIREGLITPTINITQKPNIKYQTYYRNELPIAVIPEDYGTV